MTRFDELRGKAEGLAQKAGQFAANHSDKVSEGIEKSGDFIDRKTGGKYADKVDGIQDRARNLLNNFKGNDNA